VSRGIATCALTIYLISKTAFELFLEDFRTRLPSTPLLLLSALAGGADQVVASVALQCGVELVAVLPMPKHVYRSTVDAEAQSVFDELLSKHRSSSTSPLTT